MKIIIGLSLAVAVSLYAADNSEKLDSISIVRDTSSHANNIVETNKIKASIGINAKYNKTIYGTRDNSDKIDNYLLTNLYIGYSKELKNSALKTVDVMFNINNLTDKNYLATAGAFGDTAGSSTYFVGTPRTATLKLSASF